MEVGWLCDVRLLYPVEYNLIIIRECLQRKPYREASIDTIRRWVKELFIQTNIINFTRHSCRAASTSKAKLINVNIDEILHTGCWKNEKNFLIYYYNKEIKHAPDEVDFYKIMES